MRISDWSSDVCSSDLRKEEIGARLHPIETKRVCEAVGSIRQIDGRLFGDVENARDADRRVDREAADRFHSLSYLELEQEVQKIDRLSEIAQGVAKTITDRLRNAPLISLGDRPNESLVDRLSDLEGLNIHILEWVARRRFASCGHNNFVRRCFSRISSFRRHVAQLSCCHRPFADHDRGLHFVLRIHNHRTWFGRSRLSLSCPDQWLILVNNAYFFGLRSDQKESGSTGHDAHFAIDRKSVV